MHIADVSLEELGYSKLYIDKLVTADVVKKKILDVYPDASFRADDRWFQLNAHIERDGVNYMLANHIDYVNTKTKEILFDDSSERNLLHVGLILEHYHEMVRDIFMAIKEMNPGKQTYAMSGGGCQVQVFFGDEDGYHAILGLDLDYGDTFNHKKSYTLRFERMGFEKRGQKVGEQLSKMKSYNIPKVKVE